MATVPAFEAKTRFGELLDRVIAGEEIVITRHGRPVAHMRQAIAPLRPLDFEALAALRARLPAWGQDSATLIREMRDEDRY